MMNATKDQELARIASLETMPCTDAAAPLRDLMLNFSRVRVAVMDRYPHLTGDDVNTITGRVVERSLGITPPSERDELATVYRADPEIRYSIPTE